MKAQLIQSGTAPADLGSTRPPVSALRKSTWRSKSDLGDLYVMQNEHGLIKIGRSTDPETRRRTLEYTERCAMKLVLVLPGEGGCEESAHRALQRHRIEGEWFEGTIAARKAIGRKLAPDRELTWPYALNEVAAQDWLDRFFVWRDQRSLRKHFDRFYEFLKNPGSPSSTNADIWICYCASAYGAYGSTCPEPRGEHMIYFGYRPGARREWILPYSTDVWAAMTLWPEDARPARWDGSALECSLAALREGRRRMPTGFR